MDVAMTEVMMRARGGLGEFTCHGTAAVELDTPLLPTAFSALTRNVCVTPFASPVTMAVNAVDTPSSKVDQTLPLSAENSTM